MSTGSPAPRVLGDGTRTEQLRKGLVVTDPGRAATTRARKEHMKKARSKTLTDRQAAKVESPRRASRRQDRHQRHSRNPGLVRRSTRPPVPTAGDPYHAPYIRRTSGRGDVSTRNALPRPHAPSPYRPGLLRPTGCRRRSSNMPCSPPAARRAAPTASPGTSWWSPIPRRRPRSGRRPSGRSGSSTVGAPRRRWLEALAPLGTDANKPLPHDRAGADRGVPQALHARRWRRRHGADEAQELLHDGVRRYRHGAS